MSCYCWREDGVCTMNWYVIKNIGQNCLIQTREKFIWRFVLGRNVFGQPYAMCLAVMYFNKLQSVCEGKLGAWGLKTRFDMLKFWGKKWKASSHREYNLGLLACVTSSELWPPENHQASQSSICTTQGVLNIAHPLCNTCSNMSAAYYPIVSWSVISAIIDAHLFVWTKLEVLWFILLGH